MTLPGYNAWARPNQKARINKKCCKIILHMNGRGGFIVLYEMEVNFLAEAQIIDDIIEGTWEELQERLQSFPKEQRFQLVPLPPVQEANSASQEEPSIAELFAGRVGRFHFGDANLSQNSGQKFADLMAEKKRKGRL